MAEGYREDLAYIHDAGYGAPARGASLVLLEALKGAGLDSGRVVDLGCGGGLLAEALAGAGYEVVGIDLSPHLIDLARRRVPGATFRVGSLWAADLPPCVAVSAIGECVNYLFDDAGTGTRLADLFQRVARALAPGGIFLFDAAGPGRVPEPGPARTFAEAADWAVLVTAEEDPEHATLTRRITSFRRVGALYRRDEEVHRLHLYSPALVEDYLRQAGFPVHILDGYGPVPLPPGQVGFLARKVGPARGD